MDPRIYKVVHLLMLGLEHEISLEELAQSVNLSASRLRHLFKEEMGISLSQYLKTQRLEKAKHLLETTFLNLKEVMHRAGFTDRSHFMRDFRKAYGLPPLQYRTQHLIAQQKHNFKGLASTATQ